MPYANLALRLVIFGPSPRTFVRCGYSLSKQSPRLVNFTMSTGASGADEKIGGSKIEPLATEVKNDTPLDTSSRGATGADRSIGLPLLGP